MKICRYLTQEILFYVTLFFGGFYVALMGNYIADFLDKAAKGYIDLIAVAKLLFYISPNLMLLILPMSVFGGVLVALRRLSSQNELIVMLSFGLSWKQLFFYSLIPVVMISFLASLLSFILVPQSLAHFHDLIQQVSVRSIQYLKPEKFYQLGKNKEVYIDDTSSVGRQSMVLITSNQDKQSVLYSPNYEFKKIGNTIFLNLHHGWENSFNLKNKSTQTLNFENALLNLRPHNTIPYFPISSISTTKLLFTSGFNAEVELRWRLYTGILPMISLFLAFPFCGGFVRNQSYFRTMLAIVFFVGFCILSSVAKNLMTLNEWPTWFGFEIPGLMVIVMSSAWIMLKDSRS